MMNGMKDHRHPDSGGWRANHRIKKTLFFHTAGNKSTIPG